MKIENTMEFTDLYTVESLQCFNGFHNRGYRVNRSDTDKVNRLIATIRQEREKNIGPVAGDSIEYTCRNGDWFHSAHIEDLRNGHLKICLSGSVPFCYENGAGTGYNVHEGIWTYPGKALLKPAGSRLKQFRTWGHTGKCANGEVYFMAFVRSWKYTEPEPLYDRYTTRHWSKYLINRLPDPENKGEFFYMSEGFALYSREELDKLVRILHGKLFTGIYRNSLVLWGYHMNWKLLTEQEWNNTKAEIHISFLGESPVKIITCDDNRTITVYKKK